MFGQNMGHNVFIWNSFLKGGINSLDTLFCTTLRCRKCLCLAPVEKKSILFISSFLKVMIKTTIGILKLTLKGTVNDRIPNRPDFVHFSDDFWVQLSNGPHLALAIRKPDWKLNFPLSLTILLLKIFFLWLFYL
jgi:hypothetical protein